MKTVTIRQRAIGMALKLELQLPEGTEAIGIANINGTPHLLTQEPVTTGEPPPLFARRFLMLGVGRTYDVADGENLRRISIFNEPSVGAAFVLYEVRDEKGRKP